MPLRQTSSIAPCPLPETATAIAAHRTAAHGQWLPCMRKGRIEGRQHMHDSTSQSITHWFLNKALHHHFVEPVPSSELTPDQHMALHVHFVVRNIGEGGAINRIIGPRRLQQCRDTRRKPLHMMRSTKDQRGSPAGSPRTSGMGGLTSSMVIPSTKLSNESNSS